MAVDTLILSDLHLGAPHSALNLKEWAPSEVSGIEHGAAARAELTRAIGALAGGAPLRRLVLLGDVIDLSHGDFADGITELISLLREIRQAATVQELVFVPGNHDRHWWTLQCEHESLIEPLLNDREGLTRTLYKRTTSTAGRRDVPVIRNPLHEHRDLPLTVAYPDYEFTAGSARVRCHHGHLLEDLWGMWYDVLAAVHRDLTDLARSRDPQQSPTAQQSKRLKAARKQFRDAFAFTLGVNAQPHGVLDPEIVERIGAPFVDFDWLFLGQTGLLRREGTAQAVGREAMGFLAEGALGKSPTRDAFTGLGELLALALMDRLLPRKVDGAARLHSYSNNPVKTNQVNPLLERIRNAILGKDADVTAERPGSHSPTLLRGMPIQEAAPRIARYLEHVSVDPSDVFVFGHTHRSGVGPVQVAGKGTVGAFNTGGWVRPSAGGTPESFVVSVDSVGNAQLNPVDLS